ncbi:VirB4 family type IV secretion system protein [Tengunoibacter tsumagoiensis]|uniref:TraG P-loop domain-containing protein n=1 Tax=Tengunoibacter tsumagoiensis TaxID=2014871 RepID=A0A402A0D3_9CHLR|nr:hypothetical protein [Tengunoibacter tsumagoiensis]GCE12516.1 hypothetical protein KTT_23750 [Tengunoibacter tsumagoiensis]
MKLHIRPHTVSTNANQHTFTATRPGSVQQQFVAARAVSNEILCLSTATLGQFDYVSILHIEGICYDLKSEEEQRLLNELYQAFLSALSYPVQILWRVLPLNLSGYVDQFVEQSTHNEKSHTADIWDLMATSHRQFLEQLGSQRTLLDRQIYLVIRVSSGTSSATATTRSFLPHKRRAQQQLQQQEALERARQELDIRIGEIIRLLSNMNLAVRQLKGPQELIPLYYSCLSPGKAMQYPLSPQSIDAIDRPIQVKNDRKNAPVSQSSDGVSLFASTMQSVEHTPSHESSSFRRKHGHQQTNPIEMQHDFEQLADLIAPSAIVISPDCLKVEDSYVRVLRVHHLPRMVAAGWLKPLAELDEPMEVSFHLTPLNSALMVNQFRRRQMEYLSSRMIAQRKGNEMDPHLKVAEFDVDRLIDRLASGEERMLDFTMQVVLRGASRRELNERTERMHSVLHNMLLNARVSHFEQERAFRSSLPHARSLLGAGILLDSQSASTMFPFLSNALFHPGGVLEGITPQGDPVILDSWSTEMANANRIILGPPGWGKSHQVKASIMRMALKYASKTPTNPASRELSSSTAPFQVIVIDPEREYGRMAAAMNGQVIRLAPGSSHHINPFDLPHTTRVQTSMEHGDRLSDQAQKLHTLLELMLADRTPTGAGTLTSNEKGLLDRAIFETYRKVGITSDISTHSRSAPLMRDLYDVLESGICGPDTSGLTQRLRRYVHGSLAGLFAGPTDIELENVIIVFDIHDMETELRPIGLFLVSNFVWTQSFQSRIPRQLIVDEAATLYQYASGALFLEDLVRRARKHYLGVTILSQHPIIFKESAIPANCATHVLMRQDATSLDLIQQMFKLSSREVQLLRRLGIGEALLTTSEKRLHVRFETSELEHLLATTDPRELASLADGEASEELRPLLERIGTFDRLLANETVKQPALSVKEQGSAVEPRTQRISPERMESIS